MLTSPTIAFAIVLGITLWLFYGATRSHHPALPRPAATEKPVKSKPAGKVDPLTELRSSLQPEDAMRHARLQDQAERLGALAKSAEDTSTQKQTAQGLERLIWMHLKLLIARHHLQTSATLTPSAELHKKAESVRHDLSRTDLTAEARTSREAVLAMTEERLRNISLRVNRIDEVNASLERIEAQVELSIERAVLQSGQSRISMPLDLASRMVEDADFFGASGPLVREMDKRYGTDLRMEK